MATQAGLPLSEHPFLDLANQLNIEESEVLKRLQKMKDSQLLRRVALVPNHYVLGFKANGMSVWKIKPNHIDEVGVLFASLPYVSHCYPRSTHPGLWEYNLFAMVHGRKRETVLKLVEEMKIRADHLCLGYDILFSEEILKKTGLRIKKESSNV